MESLYIILDLGSLSRGENIAEKDMQFALVGLMLNNTIKHNMEREHYLRADFLYSN